MDITKIRKKESENPYSSYESFINNNRDIYLKERELVKEAKEKKPARAFLKKIAKIIIFAVLILAIAWGGYFAFKIGFVGKKIGIENEKSSVIGNVSSLISSFIPDKRKPLRGEENGRINILLLGTAGKGKPGQNLTDTIMVMSIDTKNKKNSLFSLPRDFYANIPETSYYTKINSIYQYGINRNESVQPIRKTIEDIIGAPVNYFVILDFDGFKKIIDDIGGINVSVERDIYDPRYPGPNYSYETFEIKKGTYLMNGDTALKYVRERHDDPEGDFGRAKRQQQVMQSAKNKIFSLKIFINPLRLNSLLTDLGDNIKTDIKIDDIESFLNLSKELDTQNIANAVIDAWEKDSVLKVSHVFAGGVQAFVLVPRVGNYSEIQDIFENIFDLDSIRRRKAEIEKENASIIIANQSGYPNLPQKIKELLNDKMGIKNVSIESSVNNKISEKTTVYDNTRGQKLFTLDEIVKKLDAKLNNNYRDIIESESDLVLILGSDLGNIESFEEGNIEEFKNAEEKQEYFDLIKK
ncbi:MAG: LCP family protein [Patescibacteria group bacterium]